MSQSAISHQLKSLRLSNLVISRKEGKAVYYSLADEHVIRLLEQGMLHAEHC
jgi:DNA-binding transcriptional ArsR family regulator